jgi:hypothetical protein
MTPLGFGSAGFFYRRRDPIELDGSRHDLPASLLDFASRQPTL